MKNTLYLIRGIPGCGKSTLATELKDAFDNHPTRHNKLGAVICCADDYFITKSGEYKFDPKQIGFAHNYCTDKARMSMFDGVPNVIVSNTSTTEKEVNTYTKMATKYNYKVVSLIVENRHGGINKHNVPEDTLDRMTERFTTKLK